MSKDQFDPLKVDDDPLETTIWDHARYAARGGTPKSRRAFKLDLKDWIGYILAVLLPVTASLLVMWRSDGVMLEKMVTLQKQFDELKDDSRAQWQRFGRHVEDRESHQ